jgi:hypothetical protein
MCPKAEIETRKEAEMPERKVVPKPHKAEPYKLETEAVLEFDLTNAERAMLRSLAEPGMPLWKILRRMVDYGQGLQQSLLKANVYNPAELGRIANVQATALACIWVQENFEAALTDTWEEPEQGAES